MNQPPRSKWFIANDEVTHDEYFAERFQHFVIFGNIYEHCANMHGWLVTRLFPPDWVRHHDDGTFEIARPETENATNDT